MVELIDMIESSWGDELLVSNSAVSAKPFVAK
jgi:hypothetical protein